MRCDLPQSLYRFGHTSPPCFAASPRRRVAASIIFLLGLSAGLLHGQTTLPSTMPSPPTTAPTTQLSDPPTLEQLVWLLDAQRPNEVLQHVSRILINKKLEGVYNKCDLLVLKGDALLQGRNTTEAIAAYTQAAKEAPDVDRQAYAAAMVTLVKRSSALLYTPKNITTQTARTADNKIASYDVRDRQQRRAAFGALFQDEVKRLQPEVKPALKATSLPPLAKAVGPLNELQLLERAATGDDATMSQAKEELADRVVNITTGHLKLMAFDVDTLSQRANEIIQVQYRDPAGNLGPFVNRKRGLNQAETNNLKKIITTCGQIEPSLLEFAKRLGTGDKKLEALVATAKETLAKAKEVLTADYAAVLPDR